MDDATAESCWDEAKEWDAERLAAGSSPELRERVSPELESLLRLVNIAAQLGVR